MNKLYVYSEEYEDPQREFLESIVLTVLVCGVCLFAFSKTFLLPKNTQLKQQQQRRQLLTEFEATAQELAELTEEQLTQKKWSKVEIISALKYGPKQTAQLAVVEWMEQRAQKKQNTAKNEQNEQNVLTQEDDFEISDEIISLIQRQIAHTPFAALLNAHFEAKFEDLEELEQELNALWADFLDFKYDTERIAETVDDWGQELHIPNIQSFEPWLRVCAMRTKVPGNMCREFIWELKPKFGNNFIELLDFHVRAAQPLDAQSMISVQNGLVSLVNIGPPPTLSIASEQVPVANKAAIFLLCRAVHHPNRDIAVEASRGLGEIAGMQLPANAKFGPERWKDACRVVFGGTRAALEPGEPPGPTSAVKDLELDDQSDPASNASSYPDPSIYAWRKSGKAADCERQEEHDAWRCVEDVKWTLDEQQDIHEQLKNIYIDTRHIEWGDSWSNAAQLWEIEKKERIGRMVEGMLPAAAAGAKGFDKN